MFLLDVLRCILCCGDEEQEQDSYRNNRDYSSLNPPIPKSRSSPQNHVYSDESWHLLPPASSVVDTRGNLKLQEVTSSHGDRNRILFSNSFSPSLSSSVWDSSTAAPLSSKPTFAPVSSTNSNISVARFSIGPEKFQIKNNSATCSPETPYIAHPLSKFPSSHNISSTAPAPPSKNPSFAPTPAPSSKKPPLASVSSTINKISAVGIPISQERPGVSTLLCKCDPLNPSYLANDSVSPPPKSKASSSNKPSLSSPSSTSSSISKAPVRVWQEKTPIPQDSATKFTERTSSSSPSLPSLRNDAISHVPISMLPPDHFSTTYNSVSWQKNKQTSMLPSRESVQNLPASSSKASSSSSLLEFDISKRRVLPKYEVPKCLEEMIRNDILPPVLMRPLSSLTYGDFFATLLYAEDFYVEKWCKYLLNGITLELRTRVCSANSQNIRMKRKNTMLVERDFVAFKINSVPEKRPFLLSRDFVFLKPLNEIAGPFKGQIYRVVKSTILVEFVDDFHSQHSPSKRYDVSFSFNRVCLKRAHQAISVASDPSFHSILFPDQNFSSHTNNFPLHENVIQFEDHVRRILNHKGPIPYLVNGQLVKERVSEKFSFTGQIIKAAMLHIYRTNPRCRILVCSPTNITSDLLLGSLRKEIPVSRLFRANAAYRDYDLVPDDIIPASLYEEEEECFTCPSLSELLNFNIITCTFMSSFRLSAAGIDSKHFTHIFLVDASLATEPEAIVPLAHLAGRNTVIVVTGSSGTSPYWVRADIARKHGLKVSYFNRLLAMEPYRSNDSIFVAHLA